MKKCTVTDKAVRKGSLEELIKYRWLLQQLVNRDLKVKYKRSILGYAWSLLNPLLMMIVISIVFSYIFRFNIENFPIYLLCGLVLFNFFAESTSMAMVSIIQSAGLIKKVYIPKYIFPLSRVLSCFVNLLFSLLAVVIMLIITRTPVTWTILLFPIPLLYVLLISLGVGMFMSVLATFFRDMTHLYNVFIQALMYFTPLFYPIDVVPSQVQMAIKFNPMYHVIDYFRNIVMYGTLPSLRDNIVCILFCIISLTVGIITFKKKNKDFLLYI